MAYRITDMKICIRFQMIFIAALAWVILFAEPTFRANAQEGENEGLDDAIIV